MTANVSRDGRIFFASSSQSWLIGSVALLLYLLTLSHWITPGSLETIANTSGWNEHSGLAHPLATGAFLAFRFLPEAWIPLVANLASALCAALVLVLLARSVALLRYDMQPEGDIRKTAQVGLLNTPSAWMSPALAVAVCGLQSMFWEHATSATGEMLGLVLFAYSVRCLLEYRVSQDGAWLTRGIIAYGAGMADNWMMIGYLPVLIAALIGLKGLRAFLQVRFLFLATVSGLGGMVLCVLLPALASLWSSGLVATWTSWLVHLKALQQMLMLLQLPQLRLFVVTGLIPFLILSVRWKSHTIQAADDTPQGVFMAKAMGHFVHFILFIAALWLALEPALTPVEINLGGAPLIHRFIWAMAAGYCAGYTLLFKQGTVQRRPSKLARRAVGLMLIVIAGILTWKNWGAIRITNSAALRDMTKALADDLPRGDCAVLSEEPRTLMLLRAELGARGRSGEVMLVDTAKIISPRYHRKQAALFGSRWPKVGGTNSTERITPDDLVKFLTEIAQKESVFYAHPSSGLFFEPFTSTTAGFLHRLAPRNNASHELLATEDKALSETAKLWRDRWTSHLAQLTERISSNRTRSAFWKQPALKWLRVENHEAPTALFLSNAYSKSLNHFGVQLQRAGRNSEAAECFQRASLLNPLNLAALINRESNSRHQRGDNSRLTVEWVRENFSGVFDQYDNWWDVISRNGPVDEATFLLKTGQFFLATRNPFQAIEAFARCGQLSPDWPMAKLAESQARNVAGDFDGALKLTDALDAMSEQFRGPGLAQLLAARVTALRGLKREDEARACIRHYGERFADHSAVLSVAAALCSEGKNFESELGYLRTLETRNKSDARLLGRIGLAEFRLGKNKEASETISCVLELTPDDVSARLLRAAVRLSLGENDGARADYEALLKTSGASQPALFGLGNMAWRAQDTNAAIRYYELFMSNNAYATPQSSLVSERLKQMKEE